MRPVPSLEEGAGVTGITSCSPARCTVSCSSRPGLSLPGGEQRREVWCPCQRSYGLQAVWPRGERGNDLQSPIHQLQTHHNTADPPQLCKRT